MTDKTEILSSSALNRQKKSQKKRSYLSWSTTSLSLGVMIVAGALVTRVVSVPGNSIELPWEDSQDWSDVWSIEPTSIRALEYAAPDSHLKILFTPEALLTHPSSGDKEAQIWAEHSKIGYSDGEKPSNMTVSDWEALVASGQELPERRSRFLVGGLIRESLEELGELRAFNRLNPGTQSLSALQEFGLDETNRRTLTIRFEKKDPDGQLKIHQKTIYLGKLVAGNPEFYAQKPGNSSIILLRGEWYNQLKYADSDLYEKRLFRGPEQPDEVRVQWGTHSQKLLRENGNWELSDSDKTVTDPDLLEEQKQRATRFSSWLDRAERLRIVEYLSDLNPCGDEAPFAFEFFLKGKSAGKTSFCLDTKEERAFAYSSPGTSWITIVPEAYKMLEKELPKLFPSEPEVDISPSLD